MAAEVTPLFQRHDTLQEEGLRASLAAGLSRESGIAIPKEKLLADIRGRVEALLGDNREAGDWKERLVALLWYAALPIYTRTTLPAVATGAPFWLFDPALVDADARAGEDPTLAFYVKASVVGFNFFLREVVYEETAYLTLRLQRAEPFKRVTLLNLTPVIGASTQEGYRQLRDSVTRGTLDGALPPGLLLASG